MNGWWKFHRGYWDILSRLSHSQLAVAVYVFNSANNKDRDWFDGLSRITIKKGSFVDSQLKIAEACKTTRQVVRDCLSQLQQNGLISIGWFDSKKNQVRTNRSTNEGTKRYSLITVIESPTFPGYIYDKEPSEEPSLPLKENQVRTTTGEGKKEKKGRRREEILLANPDGFAAFWSAYPRKVGKGQAEKAWNKIAPQNGLVEAMLASIAAHLKTDQWKTMEYIPHPATFLNGKLWEDELVLPVTATKPVDLKAHWKSQEAYLVHLKAGRVGPQWRVPEWEQRTATT